MFLPKIELLPRELLVQTSDVDHADWNYRPLLGKLQRVRFQLIKALLRNSHGTELLEVGYGSGVFFPELLKHCQNISGVDIHPMPSEVSQSIEAAGIRANLHSADVCDMPFPDDAFDIVVAVSALEYVPDIDKACLEKMPRKITGIVVRSCSPHWIGTSASSEYADGRGRPHPGRLSIVRCVSRRVPERRMGRFSSC